MYDELVKRLRVCPDYNEGCVNCPHEHDLGCRATTMHEAADAIEELQAEIDTYRKLMTQEHNRAARLLWDKEHCWIPVTKRLPKEWWPVLGLIQYHDEEKPPAQQVLWYLGNGHWRETWRGDMIESEVTHWMPLPSTEGLNET